MSHCLFSFGPRRRNLAGMISASLLVSGCGSHTPAETLVGRWQGSQSAGSVRVSSSWQFHRDGTETASVSLPQGVLMAEGTWTLRARTLTLQTTRRSMVLGGQQKSMPLSNPVEIIYDCAPSGDSLLLTRPGTQETLTLTRQADQTP